MKATSLIENQHREVEKLFESLEASPGADLVQQLATALAAHATMEEELFYPFVKRLRRDLAFEAHEEHEVITHALKRLVAGRPDAESFRAKVKACKDVTQHHVAEEEKEVIPAVADALEEEEDKALGQQMAARYEELVAEGYESIMAARKARRDGHAAKPAKKKATHAPRREA
jgi:hemerythrin superfamily protein